MSNEKPGLRRAVDNIRNKNAGEQASYEELQKLRQSIEAKLEKLETDKLGRGLGASREAANKVSMAGVGAGVAANSNSITSASGLLRGAFEIVGRLDDARQELRAKRAKSLKADLAKVQQDMMNAPRDVMNAPRDGDLSENIEIIKENTKETTDTLKNMSGILGDQLDQEKDLAEKRERQEDRNREKELEARKKSNPLAGIRAGAGKMGDAAGKGMGALGGLLGSLGGLTGSASLLSAGAIGGLASRFLPMLFGPLGLAAAGATAGFMLIPPEYRDKIKKTIGDGAQSLSESLFGKNGEPGLYQKAIQTTSDFMMTIHDGVSNINNTLFHEESGLFTRAVKNVKLSKEKIANSVTNLAETIFGDDGFFAKAAAWFSSDEPEIVPGSMEEMPDSIRQQYYGGGPTKAERMDAAAKVERERQREGAKLGSGGGATVIQPSTNVNNSGNTSTVINQQNSNSSLEKSQNRGRMKYAPGY